MLIQSRLLNFIHVPKAAGSSIEKLLKTHTLDEAADERFREGFASFAKGHGISFPNHASAQLRVEFLGMETYRRYFSFAFVRNPFDLVVSLYEYTHQRERALFEKNGWELRTHQKNILENSFEDWVLNFSTGNSQSSYILSESGSILVDFIGRTESLDSDIMKLYRLFGVENPESMPRSNATRRDDYQSYYSDATKAVIAERYVDDLRLFGYEY